MSKPLTLSAIKQEVELLQETKQHNFTEDIHIDYDVVFSYSKMDSLYEDLTSLSEEAKSKDIDYLTNDTEIIEFLQFLIVKHFTSLSSELNGKSLEVHIATMSEMYDRGWLNIVLDKLFDKSQIYTVYDRFYEKVDLITETLKLEKSTFNDLKVKVESEMLKNKTVH